MPVKVYDGTNWVTVAGDGQQGAAATSSTIATWVKTASGGETTLSGNDDNSVSLSYTAGQELLYINGVLQKRAVDYVASTGTTITGLNALVAGDVVTVWTVNAFSVTNAIPNSTITAKGNLIVGTGTGTYTVQTVGTDGQVLTADSAEADGVKWATPASGTYSSWTPTLTNITLGNGTMTGRYTQIGKFVNASLKLVFGTTTSVSGTMTFSLPTGASSANTATNTMIGTIRMLDTGIANYVGMVQLASSSAIVLTAINVNGTYGTPENFNATTPFTWGNLDEIEFSISYEAV
jgi:hypothetical protein